ncbi:hypothetical protein PFISCL1PPCAC_26520 [Pristionchus fissidentatus]|uniref:Sushi domain-containing protein n=1 Tax=Pristionchus fissidentatus TaxID=1538716 RepID=A0AAV5WV98_9BILA|nr:hypothetical protein PFISCL1PPCAC_26520 [Pristionchus fissidentatus]
MPEVGCLNKEQDCNPLPGGSTTTSFVCPDGMLASREQASIAWRSEGITGPTCDVEEKIWNFGGFDENRLYACLSPSNDCGFSVLPCPSFHYCHGSVPTEVNRKPKTLECSVKGPYQMYTETNMLDEPQICNAGKWSGTGEWHLSVYCGYVTNSGKDGNN